LVDVYLINGLIITPGDVFTSKREGDDTTLTVVPIAEAAEVFNGDVSEDDGYVYVLVNNNGYNSYIDGIVAGYILEDFNLVIQSKHTEQINGILKELSW
jgi:hypothetical protein